MVPNGRPPVFEALQSLAYIGLSRINVTHAGNESELQLPGVPNVKVDVYCAENSEVFEYLACLWHGWRCMLNRHKPIGKIEETLLSRYVETQSRLQKIEKSSYEVISIWGCEFRKPLRDNSDLQK